MKEVAKAEDKLDILKLRHQEIAAKYGELHILSTEDDDAEDVASIQARIEQQTKLKAEACEKQEALVLLYDKIIAWGHKILKKLDVENSETRLNIAPANQVSTTKNTLFDLFTLLISTI